jgi:hypothetical protein
LKHVFKKCALLKSFLCPSVRLISIFSPFRHLHSKKRLVIFINRALKSTNLVCWFSTNKWFVDFNARFVNKKNLQKAFIETLKLDYESSRSIAGISDPMSRSAQIGSWTWPSPNRIFVCFWNKTFSKLGFLGSIPWKMVFPLVFYSFQPGHSSEVPGNRPNPRV